MNNHSENTKRIAKNTLMLYGRMLFSMVVSLYTSRVVLNTLGVEDYGIYGAVGGFVSMFWLISSSLSSAVSRFLTYELGRGDKDRLRKTFSTSVLVHLLLIAIVLLIAETLGVWFVNNKMTIPSDRLDAANWVFQASVLSSVFGLLSVPYNASIVSHEKMGAFAYIGIIDTLLRLIIVLFISYSPWHFDRLIVYAFLLVAVNIALQCIYMIYCYNNFEECRLKITLDKRFLRDISTFAGWNFIGCTAHLLKDHGVNVLLNVFGGPILNAARSIATSVNAAVYSFTNSFMTALNPQITKSYASDDFGYMGYLVEKGARFSFYILMLLAVPIIIETDYILDLWLGNYPEHAVSFVRLVLILSLTEVLSNPLITVILATGQIRNYQLLVGGIYLLNFPLSYICLKFTTIPELIYIVAILISVICLFLRLMFLKKMVHLDVNQYVVRVILNVILVSLGSSILPFLIKENLEGGLFRFCVVGLVAVICSVFSILYIGCSSGERDNLLSKIPIIKNLKKNNIK